MSRSKTGFVLISALCAAPAYAAPLPDPVAAMIRAAGDSGDAAALKTVSDLAKKTNPDSAAEVDAMVAEIGQAAEEKRVAKMREQGFFEGWKGQGQAGASIATGNTDAKGFSVGLNLNKEGLRWRHAITATFDYARQNGETSQDRYLAAYEANYKFNERLYALGLISWEKDRFAGFSRRFSEAFGIGYAVIRKPGMHLNIEAGPALRQTRYIDGSSSNDLAGRGALDFSWQLGPDILFTENAGAYVQSDNSTLTATTALTFKLNSALSLQTSFRVNHETNPPFGLKNTDTTSRFTLVYGF